MLNLSIEVERCTPRNWAGIWLTMLTKMISDMPLPTPRWVMSSPSHMMKAVPAVRVSTISSTRPALYSGMRSMPLVSVPRWNR